MTNKIIVLIWGLLTGISAFAQRSIQPSDTLWIRGMIKNPGIFTCHDLDTFATSVIKNQIIHNQKGEMKDTLWGLKGIPIKALLASTQYKYDKPKELNEFYFVFTAGDGYKVVFSWNEIYNTDAGDNFFILTEMKGKKLKDMEQRIIFISTADLKAGRRYIKSLEKIEVKKIE